MGEISSTIQQYAEACGFSVVREYGGHGVGRQLHEPPQISNYSQPHTGPLLLAGMTFTLEPVVNAGHWLTTLDDDGGTVRTENGSLSAHSEHSLAVTSENPPILTSLLCNHIRWLPPWLMAISRFQQRKQFDGGSHLILE